MVSMTSNLNTSNLCCQTDGSEHHPKTDDVTEVKVNKTIHECQAADNCSIEDCDSCYEYTALCLDILSLYFNKEALYHGVLSTTKVPTMLCWDTKRVTGLPKTFIF